MFIDGIAGIANTTVTTASATGWPPVLDGRCERGMAGLERFRTVVSSIDRCGPFDVAGATAGAGGEPLRGGAQLALRVDEERRALRDALAFDEAAQDLCASIHGLSDRHLARLEVAVALRHEHELAAAESSTASDGTAIPRPSGTVRSTDANIPALSRRPGLAISNRTIAVRDWSSRLGAT